MRTPADDERPLRTPNVVAEPSGNDHIVHRNTHEDFVLNPTAFALWELCDGRTTLSEMVEAVCDLFEIGRDQARADVVEGIRHMKAAGILA